MTVEDKIDDKELKDINPQRDDYEDEIEFGSTAWIKMMTKR